MNDRIRERAKRIPLRTRIKVDTMAAFINLLSELGYKRLAWSGQDEEKLFKMSALAEKYTTEVLETIKKWEEDGSPV